MDMAEMEQAAGQQAQSKSAGRLHHSAVLSLSKPSAGMLFETR
jgi:hypothetical protein